MEDAGTMRTERTQRLSKVKMLVIAAGCCVGLAYSAVADERYFVREDGAPACPSYFVREKVAGMMMAGDVSPSQIGDFGKQNGCVHLDGGALIHRTWSNGQGTGLIRLRQEGQIAEYWTYIEAVCKTPCKRFP